MLRCSLCWAGSAALLVVLSCGSRSALPGPTSALTGGAGGQLTSGGSGGIGGATVIDAGPDAPPPPPPCTLVAVGPVIDAVAYFDRHALAPSAARTGPSSFALQTFASAGASPLHDDIQLLRFTLTDAWPGGEVGSSELFGVESHGWANLVLSPDQSSLALTWHGDPGGYGRPMFRRWDLGSAAPSAPIDIVSEGEAVLDTAAGAGIGSLGVGHAGYGYGVVWRDLDENGGGTATTRPVVAVLDESGQRVLGPHPVSDYLQYPGRAPAIVWTGSAYVMATSFDTCAPGDPLCVPGSVVTTRVRPASGDAVDDSGVDFIENYPSWGGTVVMGRPALSHHAGRTYLAWSEADQSDTGAPRRLFAAELSSAGFLLSSPVLVDLAAPAQSRVTLHASDLGVSLSWVEDGDPAYPDNKAGRSHLLVTHLGHDLSVLSSRITIPITRWDTYGAPQAIALAAPKSLYVVWSGRRAEGEGYEDVFMARLDCAQ